MAEEEIVKDQSDAKPDSIEPANQDMELEPAGEQNGRAAGSRESNGVANGKRTGEESEGDEAVKKPKLEKSLEEERPEKVDQGGVKLWGKEFGSSVEMFDYFFKLLRAWIPNINLNEYEHMMLLELLKKGHPEPERKINSGVKSFQVRYHPMFKSRCFFLVREDDSVDDFSFRKCVDHILPLPEDMKGKPGTNKPLGAGGKGYGGRGGRGRGRGGRR